MDSPDDETSVLIIIQKIKDKKLDPKILQSEKRQECVRALILEGSTKIQMAQILGCSYKTILRDLEELKENDIFKLDPQFILKLIGQMMTKSENHSSFLMRLARKQEGSISEKAQSEYLAWQVCKQSIELLQTLGCLPMLKQKELNISADGAGTPSSPVINILPVRVKSKMESENSEQSN